MSTWKFEVALDTRGAKRTEDMVFDMYVKYKGNPKGRNGQLGAPTSMLAIGLEACTQNPRAKGVLF